MQEEAKVEMNSGTSGKRQRRRKQKMFGYYILVLFLAVSIGTALSMTLFFNIKQIVFIGESSYDTKDILNDSGIKLGDNLIRLDVQEARKKVLSKKDYLDDIEFRKKFADTLEIELYPSREMAYVQCQGGYMLISEGWRILEVSDKPEKKGLVRIDGFEPVSNETRNIMTSSDHDKDELLKNIIAGLEKVQLSGITVIDIDDKYDITLVYEGRISIMIGNSKDLEYKLKYAGHILTEELRNNKVGYLIYHDSLGYSYVSREEYDMINNRIVSDSPAVTVIPPVTSEPALTSAVTSQQDE